jgi:hypothetical protein
MPPDAGSAGCPYHGLRKKESDSKQLLANQILLRRTCKIIRTV